MARYCCVIHLAISLDVVNFSLHSAFCIAMADEFTHQETKTKKIHFHKKQ